MLLLQSGISECGGECGGDCGGGGGGVSIIRWCPASSVCNGVPLFCTNIYMGLCAYCVSAVKYMYFVLGVTLFMQGLRIMFICSCGILLHIHGELCAVPL